MNTFHPAALFMAALVFFASSSMAGGNDAAAELYVKIERIEFLTARFHQTVTDHEGYTSQELDGRLKLARPNKVYWETFAPYEQLVVANESRVWVYDPDLEQVTVQSSGPSLEGPMALLTESLEALRQNYDVQRANHDTDTAFSLTPRLPDQDSSFSQLSFSFDGDTLRVITITDKLRQTTAIVLSDMQLNIPIPDASFEFVAPEGVDIVIND